MCFILFPFFFFDWLDEGRSPAAWSAMYGVCFNEKQLQPIPLNKKMMAVIDKHIATVGGDFSDMISRDFGTQLVAIASLMAALACKNVSTVDVHPDPAFVKARKRRGKLPVYSYKVLHIETPLKSSNAADGSGTHASPRIHLRRGHIRRLPQHTVWVNACVVGNKERGILAKDYAVHSGAQV
jgi:hypothetical protein